MEQFYALLAGLMQEVSYIYVEGAYFGLAKAFTDVIIDLAG